MSISDDIKIEVVTADALALHTDVLVLKYAQAHYGVDAMAVHATGLDVSKLPLPGGHLSVEGPPGICADALIIVGVGPLITFGYAEIRDFGCRALTSAARACPDARVIALTLHGAGYGLDELEAFDSELAGVLDAIHDRDVPPGLEGVVIVEIDPHRAARMRSRLNNVLSRTAAVTAGAPITDIMTEPSAERFRRVGYDSARRDHAFVAMPFSTDFEDLFHYALSSAVRSAGLLCERIDQEAFTGDVVERLKKQIQTARIVVADLTSSNPNVFLEVGYAWGCGVPTILLSRTESDLKFDVQGQRCLFYSGIKKRQKSFSRRSYGQS